METEPVGRTATPRRHVARTVGDALRVAEATLSSGRAVAAPRDEARALLCALLEQPRSWPALHRDEPLDGLVVAALLDAAARRARGMPQAYAVGCAAFRHLTLDVDERALIPRPETELLVDLVLERAGRGGIAIDVGTGSGCIALSLATEGSFDGVIGTDLSLDALAVARGNLERVRPLLRAPVELRHGSLLGPVGGVRARVVVSNPPYIADDERTGLPADVRNWEPPLALYSSGGGMTVTDMLVRQATEVLARGGWLALEVDCRRASLVAERVAVQGGYDEVSVHQDLTGRERFVLARARG